MPLIPASSRHPAWRRRVIATTALTSAALMAQPALALPAGLGAPQVEAGGGAPVVVASSPGGEGVSAQMDVTLNAQRTLLRWNSLNLGATELLRFLFPSRNAIVLNQVSAQAVIDGRLEGRVGSAFGGNVWIASPNGVIFGPNARVDLGGLLATSATNLPNNFFDPSAAPVFDFTGASRAPVEVRAGAQITGYGGTLAFLSQEVDTQAGAIVQGAAADPGATSVLYGASTDFRISFAPSSTNDLDLVSFALPHGAVGSGSAAPLTLAGATTAGEIQIVAVNQAAVVGAVISAPGLQQARRAQSGANGDIILTVGSDVAGYGRTDVGAAAAPVADLRADNQIVVQAQGSVYLSNVQAGPLLSVTAQGGGVSVDNASGTGDLILLAQGGDAGVSTAQSGDDVIVRAINGSVSARYVTFTTLSDLDRDGTGPDTAGDGHRLLMQALYDPALIPPPVVTPPPTPTPPPPPPNEELTGGIGEETLFASAATLAPATFGLTTNATLGEGIGAVTGADRVEVLAPDGIVTVDLTAPVRLDAVQAGGLASVRAPSVEVRSITAGDDVLVTATAGQALVATATGADDIIVSATGGPARLQSALLLPGASDDDADAAGLDVAGDGKRVLVQAGAGQDATLGEGVGSVAGATRIEVLGGRNARVDVTSGVVIDALQAGAGSASATARAGDIAVRQAQAQQDVSISAANGAAQVDAVTAGRSFALNGRTVTLGALGGVLAGDIAITATQGGFARDVLSAGGAITVDVAGLADLGRISAGTTARIAASDLTLTGSLTARRVQIESHGGPLALGDNVGGVSQGLFISAAEFNRIQVTERADFYAGITTPATPSGDVLLGDLAFSPQRVPAVGLYAGSANDIRVLGAFRPTVAGGALTIGDEAASSAWRPRSIQITGSLGQAQIGAGGVIDNVLGFGDVRLSARQDIHIGSPRFVSLASAIPASQFDLGSGRPAGAAPVGAEQNRIFITAGSLGLRAPGRIVQQNTATDGAFAGIYLTNNGATPGPVLSITEPAAVIDLAGAYVRRNGSLASGRLASLSADLVLASGVDASAAYRFNGCIIPTGSNCAELATPIFRRDFINRGFADFNWPLDALRPDNTALLLSPWSPDQDSDERPDPIVTGAGNEEIWRTSK